MAVDLAALREGGQLGLALDLRFIENHYVYAEYAYLNAGGKETYEI